MKIAAVIFDLDGTVLDNEDEYGLAFRKVLRQLGKVVDKKYPHIGGIGVKENWPILLAKYKIKTNKTLEELAVRTQDEYLKLLKRVTLKKGFLDYAQSLKDSGMKIALATSNSRWVIDAVLAELNLKDFFDIITSGEDVEYKKPDPELFLLAAEKLNLEPENCLVFEDSAAGIEAAHRAGMKVVALARDSSHAETLKEADRVIMNYSELDLLDFKN